MLANFSSQILIFGLPHLGFDSLIAQTGIRDELVHMAQNQDEAKTLFNSKQPQIVLVLIAQEHRGQYYQFIKWLDAQNKPSVTIAATTHSSPEIAAASLRAGATDFFDLDTPNTATRLAERIKRVASLATQRSNANEERKPLNDENNAKYIGSSQKMVEVAQLIINASKSNASVFITGENGTGKEVCAKLIHEYSNRNTKDMVTLNCAAIPDSLAESELFGHVKGAFTGAINDRDGVSTQADKGTLFLDEIGEMSLETQSKLLRFVQTGYFNKVGSNQIQKVDARFICATNREPLSQIQSGQFRQDLYYRLNVIQIHLPPLRERGEDIITLAKQFLTRFSKEESKSFVDFSPETIDLLKSYSWPGNIRELQNVIRNIVVLHNEDIVLPSMLPFAIIKEKGDRRHENYTVESGHKQAASAKHYQMIDQIKELNNQTNDTLAFAEIQSNASNKEIRPLNEIIDESIQAAIELCQGNVAEASQKLGVSASTIYRKLKN